MPIKYQLHAKLCLLTLNGSGPCGSFVVLLVLDSAGIPGWLDFPLVEFPSAAVVNHWVGQFVSRRVERRVVTLSPVHSGSNSDLLAMKVK